MLDAEKKELLTDLHLARSPLNNVKDNKIASEIVRLLNLTDKYDAEIQSEKMQVIRVHWSLNASNIIFRNIANHTVHSCCRPCSE